MNLLEIRKNLVQWSGRYDLVDSDWNDEGADFFINSGVRHLDQRTDFFPMANARVSRTLDIGQTVVYMDRCRYLDSVYAIQDDDSRELEKLQYNEIVKKFPESDINNISKSDPMYFIPGTFKIDEGETFIESQTPYDSLLILPPPSETIDIVIHGAFFSPELTENYHVNSWSAKYPNVLLMAAMREMEVFHRNTAGVQDWEAAMMREIRNIQMDRVSEEVSGVNQMEG